MLLRESAKHCKLAVDLRGVVDTKIDAGVPEGRALINFTDALVEQSSDGLRDARQVLAQRLGADAVVQSAAVAATFSMLDRVANATGIPFEKEFAPAARPIQNVLGLEKFRSAANSAVEHD